MVSIGPLNIGSPSGLWALTALIPLIILYLIRPRPKPLSIPSLMFFMKSSGSKKLTSFLKQITHDWLFLIQLLLLLALALTFSEPFTNYEHDVTASNTVIVVDVSASSQTIENGKSRFDLEIDQALKVLGTKNSVILAKGVPHIALQDKAADETAKFLRGLKPRSTISKIGEAIILAGETLGTEGRVVVVSDFINTEGQDPNVAKAVLESKGIVVDFINIAGGQRKNIGIIQIDAANDQTTVYVKNYNSKLEKVPLQIGATTTELSIASNSIESYSFKTPLGVSKIQLGVNDALPADNIAYLSAPATGRVKINLVSNNVSTFMKNALLASGDFEVTISQPPVIEDGLFDVIIVHNVNIDDVLPGTFENFLKLVETGTTVIAAVQDDSDDINYQGIMPFTIDDKLDGGFITIEQLNRFTKNIEFGTAEYVWGGELIGDQTIIATVNDVPAITIKSVGLGKLVYFGIPEGSEFKYSPHFPIFWTELLKFVTEQQDVKNLNFKAGSTLLLNKEQKIKTPLRTIKRAALVLDEAGLYELEDRIIAVNLVDKLESDINLETSVGTKSTDYELRPVKETRKFYWEVWLLAFALLFIIFEIYFVKHRGDL